MIRKLLTMAILLTQVSLHAEEYTDKSFSEKLQVVADQGDETVKTLFDITKKVHSFLTLKLSKIPGKAPTVTLKVEGTPPSTDTFRIIYFKRSELNRMNSMEIVHRIMHSLIRRSLVSLGAANDITTPDWLTAGLTYQFIVGETMSTEEKYPLTRLSVINKKYPDLDQLLTGEAPNPESFWLYTIFAERSAVFHRGIFSLKSGRVKLLDFLIDRKEKTIIDHFSKEYEKLKTARLRRVWFKQSCFRVCIDVINPYPPEEINRKVSELLSVTVARPGNNGFGTMKLPLEELSGENSKFIDTNYLTFLERDLLELLLTSSETIRPSIKEIVLSLRLLKEGNIDDFKESLKISKKKFKEAIRRQIELNRYLDTLEKKHNQLQSDYGKIIQAEELADKRNRVIFKDFNKYLDEIEKKLASIKIE